ncbi:MAG: App1 family protein [Arcicella sp.]|nr:App1 family protein [Arcicella sp.]
MSKEPYQFAHVKVYHGYGHKNNLVVYGHVLAGKPVRESKFTDNIFSNVIHLTRLFFVKPIPNARVQLIWENQALFTTTEKDGFFKFEWKSINYVPAGWHQIIVHLLGNQDIIATTGEGKIFVPHSTQYGFISDIDDTVLISHSATTGKKLRVMFTKNPRSRKTFADVVKFYNLLAKAHTEPETLNPFFYVSSSEWNLYDDLNEFFKFNGLPKGAFLLNQIKRWYQLFKTGNTKHQGKLIRVKRILDAFPKQRFILLGDNSQSDPDIYVALANKYPDKIVAIYIRNISPEKEEYATNILKTLQDKTIETCLFKHTDEAILHSKSIRLIV